MNTYHKIIIVFSFIFCFSATEISAGKVDEQCGHVSYCESLNGDYIPHSVEIVTAGEIEINDSSDTEITIYWNPASSGASPDYYNLELEIMDGPNEGFIQYFYGIRPLSTGPTPSTMPLTPTPTPVSLGPGELSYPFTFDFTDYQANHYRYKVQPVMEKCCDPLNDLIPWDDITATDIYLIKTLRGHFYYNDNSYDIYKPNSYDISKPNDETNFCSHSKDGIPVYMSLVGMGAHLTRTDFNSYNCSSDENLDYYDGAGSFSCLSSAANNNGHPSIDGATYEVKMPFYDNFSINSLSQDYNILTLTLPNPLVKDHPTDDELENTYVCSCPTSVGNPFACQYCLQDEMPNELNFYISKYDLSNNSWWQTYNGNIYAASSSSHNRGIESLIPYSHCYLASYCNPALMTSFPKNKDNYEPGIPMTGGAEIVTYNQVGSYKSFIHEVTDRVPDANNAHIIGFHHRQREDYNYFARLLNLEKNPSDDFLNGGQEPEESFLPFDGLNNFIEQDYYYYGGDNMIIRTPWIVPSDREVIVFVNGNLTFDTMPNQPVPDQVIRTQVEDGGFLMFIVKGDIIVTYTVGHRDLIDSTPVLEGVFVADGDIRIEGNSNEVLKWICDEDVNEGNYDDDTCDNDNGNATLDNQMLGETVANCPGDCSFVDNMCTTNCSIPGNVCQASPSPSPKPSQDSRPYSAHDRRFIGKGTFVAWNSIILSRDFDDKVLGRALNNTLPAEIFIYEPQFIANLPERLLITHRSVQEGYKY